MMPRAARVLIDGPSELIFTYRIPESWVVRVGCRVEVPLRQRQATGTVLEVLRGEDEGGGEESPRRYELRDLVGLLSPEPVLTPGLLELARWMSRYYVAPLESVLRAILPEAVRQESGSIQKRKVLLLSRAPEGSELEDLEKKAPRQAAILGLLTASPEGIEIARLTASRASWQGLVEKGWARVGEVEKLRDPDEGRTFLPSEPLEPSREQGEALRAIGEGLDEVDPAPILLHGVTGSGKTEVYLQAVAAVLKKGKQALVLLPEISLAPQTVSRFKSRFLAQGVEVAVLHSRLSQGERFDQWHRIARGECQVVIGARSALFAPLQKLGLLIVDEEHEPAYKQDNPPKYQARDVAVVRGQMEKAVVLLGSATPSLESRHNAETGRYRMVRLTERADRAKLPLTRVIDLRREQGRRPGQAAIFSEVLRAGIEKRLERGEQSLLFLNRRGYSRCLQCPECGEAVQCKHCALAMTYHRSEERLICHLCGHQTLVPRRCPGCGDAAIRFQGYGTEKLEDITRKLFPQARIARLDTDTTRRKHSLRDTLRAFQARKIDLLLGTQMIAKGLDFPNVTLVGVMFADLSLFAQDLRASERTFQLLVQVAGRAGRGDLPGEVIIQSLQPHAPAIQFARHHDYEGFYEQELAARRLFSYPPFTHLAVVQTRAAQESRAEYAMQLVARRLGEGCPPELLLGQPRPSPLARAHDQYRFQMTVRSPSARQLSTHLGRALADLSMPDDVLLNADVDAFDLG